ncbi:ATP-binding cassette domain-containing protein [Pantoea agglomerans]|uniref:ATP-binding cassette domain-containing protein n=1 Tax=Enterobacter agglomerans TaxID=549 RepID=UPI0010BFA501|nr:ATP-binding cassette domain-containing protein [Pantoea agglomerans]TKK21981.1 ABC transporter [Pantoea agglomerans]
MNSIRLNGVSTHNLKNIDIEIYKNKITAIYGRSGAGKSSLAFSSLYKLCSDEFDALENGYGENHEYEIESYAGIIPAIAIAQSNNNNNPRSTLYSYLNIPQTLSFLAKKNSKHIPSFKFLKINKPDNECPVCKGLGEISSINSNAIINENLSIEEKPFSIWRTGTFSGLYHNLLLSYCQLENINISISYKNLSETVKRKILYGVSESRLAFKFKYKGSTRQRRAYYEGVMIFAQRLVGQKSLVNSTIKNTCTECHGSRVNLNYYSKNNIRVLGFDMLEFMTLSFSDILERISSIPETDEIKKILQSICEMDLGYLNFSRSIPSLSGGELQKLRFSRLLISNISGILLVIDEISAQINREDFSKIYEKIIKLSLNNTIVLIEHSSYFIDNADYKIHIGIEAGDKGGYICPSEYISPIKMDLKRRKTNDFIEFKAITKNNVINQEFKIPRGCLTVLTGPSGSGKSSIAKVIEENENAIYVSQKTSNFSGRSVLASTIKINTLIAEYYSKETNLEPKNFLLSKEAGCKSCDGTGIIRYERGYDKDIYLTCPTCEGSLFDKKSEGVELKVNGLNIVEFYDKEIKELHSLLEKSDIPFHKNIETMVSLGLGHLKLNRKTQTLSGGELRRIKLCEHLSRKKETKKILIVDEPVAGLDPETASKVAEYIYKKTPLFNSVIIIEHRQEIIDLADYEIKIGPSAGILGGKILSQNFLE